MMYSVTYHNHTSGSYFIGIADSYENAEKIIQEDMIANYTTPELYHIEAVSINKANPFGIKAAVTILPYTEQYHGGQ